MACGPWLREPSHPRWGLAARGRVVPVWRMIQQGASPPRTTPARMPRLVDVADWEDV